MLKTMSKSFICYVCHLTVTKKTPIPNDEKCTFCQEPTGVASYPCMCHVRCASCFQHELEQNLEDLESDDDNEYKPKPRSFLSSQKLRRSKRIQDKNKTRNNNNNATQTHDSEDSDNESDSQYSYNSDSENESNHNNQPKLCNKKSKKTQKQKQNKNKNRNKIRKKTRYLTKGSVDQVIRDPSMMSPIQSKAFKRKHLSPNSYYYRFNLDGEEQNRGEWIDIEKASFISRLKDCGSNLEWGVFSIVIPGRVGYQCSNYYRKLIKSGDIIDSNYKWIDKDGSGKKDIKYKKKTEIMKEGIDPDDFENYRRFSFKIITDISGTINASELPWTHPKNPKNRTRNNNNPVDDDTDEEEDQDDDINTDGGSQNRNNLYIGQTSIHNDDDDNDDLRQKGVCSDGLIQVGLIQQTVVSNQTVPFNINDRVDIGINQQKQHRNVVNIDNDVEEEEKHVIEQDYSDNITQSTASINGNMLLPNNINIDNNNNEDALQLSNSTCSIAPQASPTLSVYSNNNQFNDEYMNTDNNNNNNVRKRTLCQFQNDDDIDPDPDQLQTYYNPNKKRKTVSFNQLKTDLMNELNIFEQQHKDRIKQLENTIHQKDQIIQQKDEIIQRQLTEIDIKDANNKQKDEEIKQLNDKIETLTKYADKMSNIFGTFQNMCHK